MSPSIPYVDLTDNRPLADHFKDKDKEKRKFKHCENYLELPANEKDIEEMAAECKREPVANTWLGVFKKSPKCRDKKVKEHEPKWHHHGTPAWVERIEVIFKDVKEE